MSQDARLASIEIPEKEPSITLFIRALQYLHTKRTMFSILRPLQFSRPPPPLSMLITITELIFGCERFLAS